MISLFIDTSFSNVSISIVKDDKILSIIQKNIPNLHSAYTIKFVKDVLDEAGLDANQLDNIMVVNGPGSFTGVRIGVTIAKTYGYLINKDLTLISSLKSLAISSKYEDKIMCLIPANKYSYYVAIYDKEYNTVLPECCIKKDDVLTLCNKYNPYIASVDTSIIGKYKINKSNLDIVKIVNYYLDKEKVNYHGALPNYLKLPQALEGK